MCGGDQNAIAAQMQNMKIKTPEPAGKNAPNTNASPAKPVAAAHQMQEIKVSETEEVKEESWRNLFLG